MLHAGVAQQAVEVGGQGGNVEGSVAEPAQAVPAHVVAQRAEAAAEPGEHPVPDPEIGSQGVRERQRGRALGAFEGVVDDEAVDGHCLHG